MGALTIADLTPMAGEPCVHDLKLAEGLGFKRPRVIRELVERNKAELEGYGPLAVRYGKSRGQAFNEFFLNEGQALVICTLARTEKAADVRFQLIQVFLAWRRGELVNSDTRTDELLNRMARMERSLTALQSLGEAMMRSAASGATARALTYADALWSSDRPGRRPKFWADVEVRGLILAAHRQMTLEQARAEVIAQFGDARAPSRSALHRFWQKLDALRMAASLTVH